MWCCSAYLTNAICYNVISLEGARIWIQYIIYSNHVLKYWTTPLAPRIVFKIMKVIAFMQIVAPCSLVSSFLFKLLSSCCSQALFLVLELPGQWLQFLPASHMHFRKDERTAIGRSTVCSRQRHAILPVTGSSPSQLQCFQSCRKWESSLWRQAPALGARASAWDPLGMSHLSWSPSFQWSNQKGRT